MGDGGGPKAAVVDAAHAVGELDVGTVGLELADDVVELNRAERSDGDEHAVGLLVPQHLHRVARQAAPEVAHAVGYGLVALADDADHAVAGVGVAVDQFEERGALGVGADEHHVAQVATAAAGRA